MDLGQLDKGMELLHRCLQPAPEHSHDYVAQGMEAPESLRGLAGNGLREIAVRGLKARRLRLDLYSTGLDTNRPRAEWICIFTRIRQNCRVAEKALPEVQMKGRIA